jgi:hypothetical protein
MTRAEVFAPDEVAILHVTNRTVRRCFLLGTDPVSGKNYDHRKVWIEQQLERLAGGFGIDLLGYAILSNHYHCILRSRPDVVATWDDTEVARRWLRLCPPRKAADGTPEEPTACELNSIRHDPDRVRQIRSRLSDVSWWMRLLCQNIALRANHEDGETGKFWQARFRAVRLLDEAALLACAAYVDLNPIRAALAETLEQSDFTSVQRRIQTLQPTPPGVPEAGSEAEGTRGGRRPRVASGPTRAPAADRFLAPLTMDERATAPRVSGNGGGSRCSDKGFLPLSVPEYLELLDWTARQTVAGKRGTTPTETPPILERLSLPPDTWCALVRDFGRLFCHVAGDPQTVDGTRSRMHRRRFHLRRPARELLTAAG